MSALEEYEHTPERCAAGECRHAVSPRNPCRCPDCDPITREMVAGYRRAASLRRATTQSETTERTVQRTFDRFRREDLSDESAYRAALAVVDDPKRGLALYGDKGRGKSHLGAAIASECTERGVAAIFVGVDELLSRIRATFDPRGTDETEQTLITRFASAPVLVLDDFGKEALTDWTVRTLYSLINRRYERNLPLVLTSNFSAAQLAARRVSRDAEPVTYTSTIDRMIEMIGDAWICMKGNSRR